MRTLPPVKFTPGRYPDLDRYREENREALEYVHYQSYIVSDTWREVRRRYFASKMPKGCQGCGASAVDLHHRSYTNLGAEKLHDLVPVCRECHEAIHAYVKNHPGSLWKATKTVLKTLRRRHDLRVVKGKIAPRHKT